MSWRLLRGVTAAKVEAARARETESALKKNIVMIKEADRGSVWHGREEKDIR